MFFLWFLLVFTQLVFFLWYILFLHGGYFRYMTLGNLPMFFITQGFFFRFLFERQVFAHGFLSGRMGNWLLYQASASASRMQEARWSRCHNKTAANKKLWQTLLYGHDQTQVKSEGKSSGAWCCKLHVQLSVHPPTVIASRLLNPMQIHADSKLCMYNIYIYAWIANIVL